MNPLSSLITGIFANLTLFANILTLILALLLPASIFYKKNKTVQKYSNLVKDNYMVIVFVVSAVATVGSLSFSEILSFTPCKLCWFQRIFMYPTALISFIALLSGENIKKYILSLAIPGALIAVYHIVMQIFPTAFECSDEVAKCSTVEFAQYGYITIPVMSLSAFLLIIVVSLFRKDK